MWVPPQNPVLGKRREALHKNTVFDKTTKMTSLHSSQETGALLGDRYDWTTGVPDDGNDWRKFRAVPRSYPLRSLVCTLFNKGGNRRAFRLPGEGGDHFHCTVEPSSGHIRCGNLLLRPPRTMKRTKMTGDTEAIAWFTETRAFGTLTVVKFTSSIATLLGWYKCETAKKPKSA